jgi:hypothetical protein
MTTRDAHSMQSISKRVKLLDPNDKEHTLLSTLSCKITFTPDQLKELEIMAPNIYLLVKTQMLDRHCSSLHIAWRNEVVKGALWRVPEGESGKVQVTELLHMFMTNHKALYHLDVLVRFIRLRRDLRRRGVKAEDVLRTTPDPMAPVNAEANIPNSDHGDQPLQDVPDPDTAANAFADNGNEDSSPACFQINDNLFADLHDHGTPIDDFHSLSSSSGSGSEKTIGHINAPQLITEGTSEHLSLPEEDDSPQADDELSVHCDHHLL